MPAIDARRPANDDGAPAVGQIQSNDAGLAVYSIATSSSRRESRTWSQPSRARRSRSSGNRLTPTTALGEHTGRDARDTRNPNVYPSSARQTNSDGYPNLNSQIYSSQGASGSHPLNEYATRRSGEHRLVRKSTPLVSSTSMLTPYTPEPSSTYSQTSSLTPDSTPSSTPLVDSASSSSDAPFSTQTVIVLSTVLPTIILVLLAVVICLLRERRKFPSCSRRQQPGANSRDGLPVVDIRRDAELAPSISLSILRRSISPFNISLNDLSKPAMIGVGAHGSVESDSVSDLGHERYSLPLLLPRSPSATAQRPSGESDFSHRTSTFVDHMSVRSSAAPSVVFVREDGSATRRVSRDEFRRWRRGDTEARTSMNQFLGQPNRPKSNSPRHMSAPSASQVGISNIPPTEGHDTREAGRPGSRALKALGIGPTSPYGLPLPARAHIRSRSQPMPTYGIPSLQLSPLTRTLRTRRTAPSETNTSADHTSTSLRDMDSGTEIQRIHPLLSSPVSSPSTSLEATPRPSRERQPLTIAIPTRLGEPIWPVAELTAAQSPPSQPPTPPRTLPRYTSPRSRSTPRIPRTPSTANQLSELGPQIIALGRPRGMSDSEPSPETRERVLRLLGRWSENAQDEQGEPHTATITERAREVRRTRSESKLRAFVHHQPSDN